MDWNYISGFFDADGSITAVKRGRGENRTIQLSFHNTQLPILEEIKKFILNELGIKGTVVKKSPQKLNYLISYDLKYVQYRGYLVSKKIISRHPDKSERIRIYEKIQKLTPRNGKYNFTILTERNKLIEEFFN
jgi:intein/homing endonuclease